MRAVPALNALVELPAGTYEVGEPGEERVVELRGVRIGRWPVTNAEYGGFLRATGRDLPAAVAAEPLADHPATGLSREQAEAFCAWLGARLPTGDEWEAAARGADARP
jgi:toxoflavin biosynthesis protein ToxD